ncbi:MAG: hypothetical protein R6X17_15700 [Candidatus Competibacteraceae bacterium]
MTILTSKALLFAAAALMAILSGPAAAQSNTNTTSQAGQVNINRTFQCGDSNDNTTEQSGRVNINHTIQRCGNNRNQTTQFGGINHNRTEQGEGRQPPRAQAAQQRTSLGRSQR